MMKDFFNFFSNLFSIFTPNDFNQVTNTINVKNSSGVTISGNTFNSQKTVINYESSFQTDEQDNVKNIDISFEDKLSSDKKERAILNIEYMEEFIFECNKKGICPIFRYYGLFSHLSSLRSQSDMSDYNQLVLKEKELFEKMLNLDYHIKLVISLDIPIIVTKWGYSLEQTKNRIADLCNNVDILTRNHNIEIVIDERNTMDGTYILDKCVLIRALTIDPEKKYSVTKFETNPFVINNAVAEFDMKFAYLRSRNNAVRKALNISTYSQLIRTYVEGKMEAYYSYFDQN